MNEAAHGVARAGTATVFPQAIGMAATFNPELIGRVGDAVSSEARAKYNKSIRFGDRGIYKGLTYWTPNINIFRDGRWGRGQETFGEDPFLTSDMGAAYARGLQGDGEFLKAAACAKHFAVHSGPEYARHSFDAKVSMKDLWETYLPAFEQMVKAGVMGVMGAYNRTNGEPCCAHSYLMQEALFKKWGFDGYFVSDCGAVSDICFGHHVTDTLTEAAALALSKGCVLNCGSAYDKLLDAYEMDLITEEEITAAVEKLYTVRALLGEFEDERPYADVPFSVLDCPEHRALNLRTAEESLVLLRNENGFLPMRDGAFARIAVVGPCANSLTVLEGNYNGAAAEYVTVAEGMRRVFGRAEISVASGSPICADYNWTSGDDLRSEGLAAASEADVTVLCLGLDRTFEGEEMNVENESFFHGDRVSFRLPPAQQKLAEAVCDVCRNVVVLVFCGSPVDLGEKVNARVRAIVHGWYPGALGGLAAARLLHGDFSPSGRLPITFPRAETPLPDFSDYSMAGRTYRYLNEKPLFPFGFGLSYTT
ncbi:MAG: glycoside hydrolase family 3 C-terminal domain-containing protein, partial [Eubacteriales bacterium]|nr:glycoside hydrolase family 3 C-terminal domain-containing protein [Eubacteriales bacterium]